MTNVEVSINTNAEEGVASSKKEISQESKYGSTVKFRVIFLSFLVAFFPIAGTGLCIIKNISMKYGTNEYVIHLYNGLASACFCTAEHLVYSWNKIQTETGSCKSCIFVIHVLANFGGCKLVGWLVSLISEPLVCSMMITIVIDYSSIIFETTPEIFLKLLLMDFLYGGISSTIWAIYFHIRDHVTMPLFNIIVARWRDRKRAIEHGHSVVVYEIINTGDLEPLLDQSMDSPTRSFAIEDDENDQNILESESEFNVGNSGNHARDQTTIRQDSQPEDEISPTKSKYAWIVVLVKYIVTGFSFGGLGGCSAVMYAWSTKTPNMQATSYDEIISCLVAAVIQHILEKVPPELTKELQNPGKTIEHGDKD